MIFANWNKKKPKEPKLLLTKKELKSLMDILRVDYDLSINYDGEVPEHFESATKWPYADRWGVPNTSEEYKAAHELYWRLSEQFEELK